jgi:hypothetical protein
MDAQMGRGNDALLVCGRMKVMNRDTLRGAKPYDAMEATRTSHLGNIVHNCSHFELTPAERHKYSLCWAIIRWIFMKLCA